MDQLYWMLKILHLSQLPIILSPKLPRSCLLNGLLLMNWRNAWSLLPLVTCPKAPPLISFRCNKVLMLGFVENLDELVRLGFLISSVSPTKVAKHRLVQKSINTYLIQYCHIKPIGGLDSVMLLIVSQLTTTKNELRYVVKTKAGTRRQKLPCNMALKTKQTLYILVLKSLSRRHSPPQ